jgi:hypothetical protein
MTDQSWLAPPVVYEQVKTEVALNPWPVGQVKGEGAVQNAPDKVKEVLKRLPALEARFDDTDLSDAIVDSVSHLIEDLGEIDTSNMLAIFDALERHEILSMQEIASMLAVPVKMTSAPEVLLSDSIRTVDGAVLFRAGTRVTRPIAAIMGDLNEVGAITLSEERLRILGLDPTDLPPPVTGSGPRRSGYDPSEGLAMRAVPAGEIQAGDVLARTVFTSDGRLYGKSGAEVTAGMVDVLRDLSELEKIALTLWVEKK